MRPATQLQRFGNTESSAGVPKLYDPDMRLTTQWDLSALEDLEEPDGPTAPTTGVAHAVRVPVPVAMMDEGGNYRFVAHVVDDHAADYRGVMHKGQWTRLDPKKKELCIVTTLGTSPELLV